MTETTKEPITDPIERLRACFNLAWLGWDRHSAPMGPIEAMRQLLKRIAMMAATGVNTEEGVHTHIDGCPPPRPSDVDNPPDIEALAAAHHESWAGWTRYMLGQMERDSVACGNELPGYDAHRVFINYLNGLPCIQRWRRQMDTLYEDLPEKERESDRTEVRKHLPDYRPWYYDKMDRTLRRIQRRTDSGIPLKGEPSAR